MKNVQKIDLGLTGYDELFANDEERKVNKLVSKSAGSSPLSHFARRKTDATRSYLAIAEKRLVSSQDWTL